MNTGTTKPKGFGIAATMLLATLLIAAVIVPSVGAQTTVQDATDIGTSEKEVISQLSETNDFSKNAEAAEKIRKEIEQEMEKEIKASVESSFQGGTVQLTRESVYLGTDKTFYGNDRTFYDADTGDTGTSKWGLAPRSMDQNTTSVLTKTLLHLQSVRGAMEELVLGAGLESPSTYLDLAVKPQTS